MFIRAEKNLSLVLHSPTLTAEQFIKMHVEMNKVIGLVQKAEYHDAQARSAAALEKLSLSDESTPSTKPRIIVNDASLPFSIFLSFRISF